MNRPPSVVPTTLRVARESRPVASAITDRSETFDVGGDLTVNRLGFGAMRVTGEDIVGRPDDVVVASKAGLLRNREGDWPPTVTRTFCGTKCCVASTGSAPTPSTSASSTVPDTDFEASVHAFAEMRDAGQIAHVGLSNVTVEQLETATEIADIATV